jgi:hypothetical protein
MKASIWSIPTICWNGVLARDPQAGISLGVHQIGNCGSPIELDEGGCC